MHFYKYGYYNRVFISSVCDFWVLEGITDVTMVPGFQVFCQDKCMGGGALEIQRGKVRWDDAEARKDPSGISVKEVRTRTGAVSQRVPMSGSRISPLEGPAGRRRCLRTACGERGPPAASLACRVAWGQRQRPPLARSNSGGAERCLAWPHCGLFAASLSSSHHGGIMAAEHSGAFGNGLL